MRISTGNFDSIFYVGVTPFFVLRNLTKMKEFVSATKTVQHNFVKLCTYEGFYRKCWFDHFKEQFISLLNFGQNYLAQLGQNLYNVRLPVTNAWNCHSLYTAFSSNVGAWGMWAFSLFLSFDLVRVKVRCCFV